VLLTAFYTLRMVYMTFHGEFRGGIEQEQADMGGEAHGDDAHADDAHRGVHLAESPAVMVLPMVLLGIGAVVLGFVSNPQWVEVAGIPKHWITELLEHGVAPVLSASAPHLAIPKFSLGIAVLSTVIAVVGIALSTWLYLIRPWRDRDPLEVAGPVHQLLFQKYFIDALYEDALVRRAFYRVLAGATDWVDRSIVDRIVDWTGAIFRNVGRLALAPLQTGEVQAYGLAVALGSLIIVLGFLLT
jgi:NADH-quinone oxidoreductase subunit L